MRSCEPYNRLLEQAAGSVGGRGKILAAAAQQLSVIRTRGHVDKGRRMRTVHMMIVLCAAVVSLTCSQDEWHSEGGAAEIDSVLGLKAPFAVSWDMELDGGSSGGEIQDSRGKVLAYSWDGQTRTLYLGSNHWRDEGAKAVPYGDKRERAVAAILSLYANKYFTASDIFQLEQLWRTGRRPDLDPSSWTREKRYAVGMLRIAFDIEERLS